MHGDVTLGDTRYLLLDLMLAQKLKSAMCYCDNIITPQSNFIDEITLFNLLISRDWSKDLHKNVTKPVLSNVKKQREMTSLSFPTKQEN